MNGTFLREDAARSARHAKLTEGLTGYKKAVVEQLMDNVDRHIAEETNTSNIAVFTRVAKPLIRRIYADTIADKIVSVQPMTMPTQKVFFLDFVRQTAQARPPSATVSTTRRRTTVSSVSTRAAW